MRLLYIYVYIYTYAHTRGIGTGLGGVVWGLGWAEWCNLVLSWAILEHLVAQMVPRMATMNPEKIKRAPQWPK